MTKKRQKLTFQIVSKVKDCCGVWEVSIVLGSKSYTYPISSEYAVEKAEEFIRLRRYGKALQMLKQFKIDGFNAFEKVGDKQCQLTQLMKT